MTDDQLLRYSRHILLPEVGIEGQEALQAGHALVIGAGGLGSPAALYLATAGVGRITLVDDDTVDLTNLQRQVLHTTDSVGTPKTLSGKNTIARYNPEIEVVALQERAEGEVLDRLVASADVVLDCCDNFATRHAVNRACVKFNKPLVSGAAIRFDGQVSVFDLRDPEAPCYHCLFPEGGDLEELRCAVTGVFAPLTGIIGTVQAAETLKVLMGIGESLSGRLLLLDALNMEWRSIKVPRDPACPVCGARHATASTKEKITQP
ncbi:MAG: dinucleotide-utilizing protein [Betaproteobacteria bacterium]|nr:dinucleotide-utilizing protein [Betaproteobacteria bacterium]